jgi:hypothetical protein
MEQIDRKTAASTDAVHARFVIGIPSNASKARIQESASPPAEPD